jgi:spermidine/putrescine transport system substrate-binding protein
MNKKAIFRLLSVVLLAMVLVITLSLGGCKTSGTSGTTVAETTASAATTSAVTTAVETTAAETKAPAKTYSDIEKNFGGELNALFLSGYGEEDAVKSFLQKYNVTLKSTYFATFDEAYNKIKTSPPGTYDLVSVNNAYVKNFAESGILEPIDTSLLPSWEGLYQPFKEITFGIENDTNKYVAPFTWGTNPLNYNSDFMDKPDSWMITLDPSVKNKVGIVDDFGTVIYLAAFLTGAKNPSLLTQADMDKAKDLLRKLLANSDKIAASYGDLLTMFISKDVWTAFIGWEYFSIASQAENIPVELTIPKEGSFSWCDSIAIVKDAPNMDTAYGFVNQYISQEAEVFWGNFLATGIVREDALSGVDAKLVKFFPYENINKHLTEVAPMVSLPPLESSEFLTKADWEAAWNALKLE